LQERRQPAADALDRYGADATGVPGCGNKTIQGCLQDRDQNGGFDDCVTKEWTADGADQARQYGCMACPQRALARGDVLSNPTQRCVAGH